jgi:hypothetical protein
MPHTFNRFWLALGVPAVLAAAIGATVAFAQDDSGSPSTDGAGTLLQEPTPSPAPEQTPPSGGDSDGTRPEKDCPRDGGSEGSEGTSSSGSATGISFRRR